ncbi:hypothetical protein ACLMJK_009638 [Lecanora helva]
MWWPPGHVSRAAVLLLVNSAGSKEQIPVKASASSSAGSTTTGNFATCPSRSLNYITQTLPQQCLTASWASKPTSPEQATDSVTSLSTIPDDRPSAISLALTMRQEDSLGPPFISAETSTSAGVPKEVSFKASATDTVDSPQSPSEALQQTETDSPLDHSNFLSFEEWKRQNLARAGQSAENLGTRAGENEPRRRPGGINNALDSLGEDTEIEIDFGGFVNPGSSQNDAGSSTRHIVEADGVEKDSDAGTGTRTHQDTGVRKRGKDAGKTCKERSNYASFDCAATILKTNPESKGSNAVLVEHKDSYMLNVCSAKNKFFIVELCNDILIDTVVLANFEFFSSIFRTFKLSVSDRYPVKLDKWKDLGTYEARNSREVQAFLVENPLIWARYLRIEFLTHYGNEYYCPISLLRVHGTTMMEEFNHDLKRAGTEEDTDNELGDSEEGATTDLQADMANDKASAEAHEEVLNQSRAVSSPNANPSSSESVTIQSNKSTYAPHVAATSEALSKIAQWNASLSKQMEDMLVAVEKPNEMCELEDRPANPPSGSVTSSSIITPTQSTRDIHTIDVRIDTQTDAQSIRSATESTIARTSSAASPSGTEQGSSTRRNEQVGSSNQTSTNATKTHPSSTQPPVANPTLQESFFKSVHKRLQLLESNSTLSLQYIEEQSRILRDAFSKVEKRQLAKSTSFLEALNNTVLTELRDFRTQYDQIWQSTVLELSSQREQSKNEVVALSARLSLLADEMVFQKRMVILQFILILLCLGLALFSRSASSAAYLELPPLFQNAIGKSSVSLSQYAPQLEAFRRSPSPGRPPSSYGLLRGLTHRRGRSDESQVDCSPNAMNSPSIERSPPTPESQYSPDDDDHHDEGGTRNKRVDDSSNGFSHVEDGVVRQTKSSPATPSGQRDEQKEMLETSGLWPHNVRQDV